MRFVCVCLCVSMCLSVCERGRLPRMKGGPAGAEAEVCLRVSVSVCLSVCVSVCVCLCVQEAEAGGDLIPDIKDLRMVCEMKHRGESVSMEELMKDLPRTCFATAGPNGCLVLQVPPDLSTHLVCS